MIQSKVSSINTLQFPPASHHDAAKTCELKFTSLEHRKTKKKISINWQVNSPEQARYFVIYKNNEIDNPENIVAITADNKITVKLKLLGVEPSGLKITIVDRYRKEGDPQGL